MSDRLELYDLTHDIGETTNRAAERPEVVSDLAGLIGESLKETDAVVPKANPNFGKKAGKPQRRARVKIYESAGGLQW